MQSNMTKGRATHMADLCEPWQYLSSRSIGAGSPAHIPGIARTAHAGVSPEYVVSRFCCDSPPSPQQRCVSHILGKLRSHQGSLEWRKIGVAPATGGGKEGY